MNRYIISVQMILFQFVWLYSTTVVGETELILARAPQLSAHTLSKQWSPFVSYLSKETGIKIKLKVYSDRNEFEKDIITGNVDLYFGNPGYGVVGHIKQGYMPIIRSSKKLLKGILVARKNSNINSIEQLDNQTIAFPSKKAFAATLYLQSLLDTNYDISYKPIYLNSHDNSYRSVLIGKSSASAGVKRTLEAESQKLREQLQIIYTTPGLKPHPLMVHPDVPIETQTLIQKAILKLDKSDKGKKLLKVIKIQKPVISNYQLEYKALEPLAIKMYQSLLDKEYETK